MTQLTPNFTLEEFVQSETAAMMGIDNTPTPEALANLELLAGVMEQIREILGAKPITITSGYRCYDLNVACGGADNSAHLYGLAADFVCPEFGTSLDVCVTLEPHVQALGIDQLLYEYEGWTHMGLRADDPRYQCMTINDYGTTTGFA